MQMLTDHEYTQDGNLERLSKLQCSETREGPPTAVLVGSHPHHTANL